jgi:hypothetical protein
MSALRITLVMFLAAALIGCGGLTNGKPAAEKAIAQFHALFNQEKFDEIWQEADQQFRTASTKQGYDDLMGAVHRSLERLPRRPTTVGT